MLMCLLSISGLSIIIETICFIVHILDPLRLAITHLIFFVLFFAECLMMLVQIGLTAGGRYNSRSLVKCEGAGYGITAIVLTHIITFVKSPLNEHIWSKLWTACSTDISWSRLGRKDVFSP